MKRQEIEPKGFNFPWEIDEELLEALKERARKTGSLRTAIAHRIEEEGLFLAQVVRISRSQDNETLKAAEEYAQVGTLILRVESAFQTPGYEQDEEIKPTISIAAASILAKVYKIMV